MLLRIYAINTIISETFYLNLNTSLVTTNPRRCNKRVPVPLKWMRAAVNNIKSYRMKDCMEHTVCAKGKSLLSCNEFQSYDFRGHRKHLPCLSSLFSTTAENKCCFRTSLFEGGICLFYSCTEGLFGTTICR